VRRRRLIAALGAGLLATALAPAEPPPPQQRLPAFRSQTITVSIYATVSDRDGRLVPDLGRDAFQVFDNGKPVELTVFSNEIQPITVALLLDMSGSMTPRFLRVRESTFRFIDALLPHDRLRIGSFGTEVAVSPLLTGDKAVLHRVAREELWPGGGTPMWSALHEGLASLADETGRRVLLVVTDGADTGPLAGQAGRKGEVERRAVADGFMLYAVGMEGSGLDGSVVSLSEDTGGGHYEIKSDDDLQATFLRIAEELRRQYVLGFTPAVLDGREHRLEVRLTNRDLKARARRSYVARAGGGK
jgi:VWFA-related protein